MTNIEKVESIRHILGKVEKHPIHWKNINGLIGIKF